MISWGDGYPKDQARNEQSQEGQHSDVYNQIPQKVSMRTVLKAINLIVRQFPGNWPARGRRGVE
jgi:hypothetical protein